MKDIHTVRLEGEGIMVGRAWGGPWSAGFSKETEPEDDRW